MDAIRTLLLERTHTVVLDPDHVANASTRPIRDVEIERFEDELAQLGFVMSLDLAITIRRLPRGAIQELRPWMVETLARQLEERPQVPLAAAIATTTDAAPLYLRRVLPWLVTRAEQPCPWCGQVKLIAALDPCGHLVCRACWEGGAYVGCPICHRRVAAGAPFVKAPDGAPRVAHHAGELQLVHLGFDLVGAARERFARILGRRTPLSDADRAEIEVVIDAIGPKAVLWLPAKIPVPTTAAIALARLWMVGPDRSAMVRATHGHLRTATDVLRVAAVLMGGSPELVEPMALRSISRSLRRAVVEAMDRLPAEHVVEEVRRHRALWKRVGERVHPFEWADRYPNAALAFAVVRETTLAHATFRTPVVERAAAIPALVTGDVLRVRAWAAPVEEALRRGDPATALDRLAQRPDELLRRADHLVRVTPSDKLAATLAAIERAIGSGAPGALLALAAHVARRGGSSPEGVFIVPRRRAWTARRPPLGAEAIHAIVGAVRGELVARAARRRHFARAVIDRELDAWLAPLRDPPRDRAPARDARPTLWDVAAIHAAARANVIYVRDRDGNIATYRRRDGEPPLVRLQRLLAVTDHDGPLSAVPVANAPTWVAVLRDDFAIPMGSAGYVVDSRSHDAIERIAAIDLVTELSR